MPIDIIPEIIAALRSADGKEALASAVRTVVQQEIQRRSPSRRRR